MHAFNSGLSESQMGHFPHVLMVLQIEYMLELVNLRQFGMELIRKFSVSIFSPQIVQKNNCWDLIKKLTFVNCQ